MLFLKLQDKVLDMKFLITSIIIFLLSTPTDKILAYKTPFSYVVEYLIKNNKNDMNEEITRAFSMLKNLVVIYEQDPPSGLFLLEKLNQFTNKTKPVFNKTINYLYEDKSSIAAEYFAEEIGTEEAREFSVIIEKLDKLNPHEFKEQIENFYLGVMENRKTKRLKDHERRSYILYMFFALSAVLVLSNFVVVAYIIDSLENLLFFN